LKQSNYPNQSNQFKTEQLGNFDRTLKIIDRLNNHFDNPF
ncbi:MAG: hypothetical protein Terrestrivirus6_1, partial [Terrestrivirus sp.]